jgi:hydrogenase expression/formation protein HypD
MEVCGTHTMAAARYGIRSMLPKNVRLLSGPGCPVCVTPNSYLDRAVAMSRMDGVILATFGDMFKVPGSTSSLAKEKSEGRDIRIVYSPLDSLRIAQETPCSRVVFLGIGFETTAPTVAATILAAKKAALSNFFVLCGHKTIPGAMQMLVDTPELGIDGFMCPGHVSAIIGFRSYELLAKVNKVPCVVAGFEPNDILQAIYMLAKMARDGRAAVENEYSRVVRTEGNKKAVSVMEEVFEPKDSEWRGIGIVPRSGLIVRKEYSEFDAEIQIDVRVEKTKTYPGCICGEILRGVKTPLDCRLFGRECTPSDAKGACMVSSEGTCAAYFRYPQGA